MRYGRNKRLAVGSLLLTGLLLMGLEPLTRPDVNESLRRTGKVLERELPGYQAFTMRVRVPSQEHLRPGQLLTLAHPEGSEEVVGELFAIAPVETGVELTFRLLPEGAERLRRDAVLEVVYPPRSFDEHLHFLFPQEFQETLKRRLYQRSAVLLQHLKPHAYEKLSGLEPRLYGWVADVRDQTLPTEEQVKSFVASDLYPRMKNEFDEPLWKLTDLLIENFHEEFGAWGKTTLAWNVLMGDSEELKNKLEPVVNDTLEQFLAENQDDLLDRLKQVWFAYQPRLIEYFGEVVAPAALVVFEEQAGPVIVEEVILPLLDEQRSILLEAAKQEVLWAYEVTVFDEGHLFDRRFIYVARNQAFKKQEARFTVVEAGEGGPLASGDRLPARVYFPPKSPRLTVLAPGAPVGGEE